MADRKAALASLVRAVVVGQPDEFAPAVRAAYGAGVRPEELMWAVAMGASLGEVPAAVWAQGYATVHLWSWVARGGAPRADCRLKIADCRAIPSTAYDSTTPP